MKLYYAPHACSLSPHIALREAGLPFELERVDLRAKRTASGEDYLTVNPKGYVPALKFDDGRVLTEGAVIVQWVADQRPESHLAPPCGSFERLRVQEWLHYIATELHARLGPLHSNLLPADYRATVVEKLTVRLRFLAEAVTRQPFLTGDTFTVADGYAFYTLRSWKRVVVPTLPALALDDFYARVASRPSVIAALQFEASQ
ncbi:MAG TPA: glutathione transferase GstA [Burkholderiaceae bacterium]|jgi:glutathione S-transferase|nr:glutathione transferase GstA [Burkholderiaceae bacterium]